MERIQHTFKLKIVHEGETVINGPILFNWDYGFRWRARIECTKSQIQPWFFFFGFRFFASFEVVATGSMRTSSFMQGVKVSAKPFKMAPVHLVDDFRLPSDLVGDDCMEVDCRVYINCVFSEPLPVHTLPIKLKEDLTQMFLTGRNHDLVLRARDGKEYRGHKFIVSIRSSVLDEMVSALEGGNNKIALDLDGPVLHELLRLIYTGRTCLELARQPFANDSHFADAIIEAAKFYKVPIDEETQKLPSTEGISVIMTCLYP